MRRKILAALAVILLFAPVFRVLPFAASPLFSAAADIDGNGRVTSADARLLLRRSARLCVLEKTKAAEAAGVLVFGDMNGDGKVTSADAKMLLEYAAWRIGETAFVIPVQTTEPTTQPTAENPTQPPSSDPADPSQTTEEGELVDIPTGAPSPVGPMSTAVILSEGVDVSVHNGYIDWDLMKQKVDWVILRCGYGGDYTGQDDPRWVYNVNACEALDIPYGVYLYSYADSVEKAESEANHVLRLLKGHHPTLPVYYDLEEDGIAKKAPKDLFVRMAKAFCAKITDAGYEFGVYANLYWWTTYLTDPWFDGYSRWMAAYRNVVVYDGRFDIWQYTDSGKIEGFEQWFDGNHAYRDFLAKNPPKEEDSATVPSTEA